MNKFKNFSCFSGRIRYLLMAFSFLSVAVWLLLGNLGCVVESLLNAIEIRFEPSDVVLIPGQTSVVTANVNWNDQRTVFADWTVSDGATSAFSSVNPSSVSDNYARITLTARSAENLYQNEGTWTVSKQHSGPIFTARFVDPLSVTLTGEEIRTSRQRYLPVQMVSPTLSLKFPVINDKVSGDGYVRSLMLGGKAEVIGAPAAWKYEFDLSLKIIASFDHWPTPLSESEALSLTVASFENENLPLVPSADGKSVRITLPAIGFGKMETYFSNSSAVLGEYFLSVSAEAKLVGGEENLSLRKQFQVHFRIKPTF